MQTVTATDAKNNFGDLMSRIESGPVSITRNGRIVATLSPASPAKTVVSSAEIDKLLALYADGLMNRHDIIVSHLVRQLIYRKRRDFQSKTIARLDRPEHQLHDNPNLREHF